MEITESTLAAQYEWAVKEWPFIPHVEVTYNLPRMLLFAVGSRETNVTNEVGDGGHGHGVWQLDDRSHSIPPNFDHDVQLQCQTAAEMLRSLIRLFPGHLAAAVASYNAGTNTVKYNITHGFSVDTGTAHGNYSKDVLARMRYLQERFPVVSTTASQTTAYDIYYSTKHSAFYDVNPSKKTVHHLTTAELVADLVAKGAIKQQAGMPHFTNGTLEFT